MLTRFAGGVSRSPRPVLTEEEADAAASMSPSPIKSPSKFGFDRRKIDPNPFAGLEAHTPIVCQECGPISDAK